MRTRLPGATLRPLFAALTAALLLGPSAALWTSRAAAEPRVSTSCVVDRTQLAPDAEEQAALAGTNAYRAANGLPLLHFSYALTVTALWKSTDMATQHYFSHDDLTRSWVQRFLDCGYAVPDAFVGENLAGGNATGLATLQQWQNSPHHNANLLDPNFTAVGIKRVRSSDQTGWYWTMDLGSSLDADLGTVLAAP